MGEKKLDFNAPLLSARRYPSLVKPHGGNAAATTKKRDFEVVEVTKPGAIPFLWEHTPGRAKNATKPEDQIVVRARLSADETEKESISLSRLNVLRPRLAVHEVEKESISPSSSLSYSSDHDCDYYDYDDDDPNSTPTRTFFPDPETLDFMMDRFIPAAKSMVIETRRFSSKKQIKKEIDGEKRVMQEQYSSNILSHYDRYLEDFEKNQEQEQDEELDRSIHGSSKSRGLFSRFGFKKSLCLFNRAPENKLKTDFEVKRPTRATFSGPLDQIASETIYKKKFHSGVLSRELFVGDTTLRAESEHFSFKNESISPYRNVAPLSPFRDGAKFLGLPKDFYSFEAKLRLDSEDGRQIRVPNSEPVKTKKFSDEKIKNTKKSTSDSCVLEKTGLNLHPPLPKSPSESWLWRDLSPISLKTRFSDSSLLSKKQHSKTIAKWEMIVKTSRSHNDHVRYSEELATRVSQHSKQGTAG